MKPRQHRPFPPFRGGVFPWLRIQLYFQQVSARSRRRAHLGRRQDCLQLSQLWQFSPPHSGKFSRSVRNHSLCQWTQWSVFSLIILLISLFVCLFISPIILSLILPLIFLFILPKFFSFFHHLIFFELGLDALLNIEYLFMKKVQHIKPHSTTLHSTPPHFTISIHTTTFLPILPHCTVYPPTTTASMLAICTSRRYWLAGRQESESIDSHFLWMPFPDPLSWTPFDSHELWFSNQPDHSGGNEYCL